jgi:hypothetical protein
MDVVPDEVPPPLAPRDRWYFCARNLRGCAVIVNATAMGSIRACAAAAAVAAAAAAAFHSRTHAFFPKIVPGLLFIGPKESQACHPYAETANENVQSANQNVKSSNQNMNTSN